MMFADLRSAAAERNLMFDPVLHEMLEIMPAELRASGNLGPRIVSRLCRSAGRVANANSLLPMCWPARLHQWSKTCKPMVGAVRRRLLGNPHTTTGSWPNRAVLYQTHTAWRRYLEHLLLETEWLDPAVFDRDAVKRHWRAFLDGQTAFAQDIERLAALALVFQLARVGAARFVEQAMPAVE
jgi:hypothetical protein